jgi:hypothetical protein
MLLASLLLLACYHIVGVPAVAVVFALVGVQASLLLLFCGLLVPQLLLAYLLLPMFLLSLGDPTDSEESVCLFQHISSTNQLD